MPKGHIATLASARGELVYYFNQADSPAVTQPGPWGAIWSTDGYCAGLALKWISLRALNDDLPYDPATLMADSLGHWEATKLHNMDIDLAATNDPVVFGQTLHADPRIDRLRKFEKAYGDNKLNILRNVYGMQFQTRTPISGTGAISTARLVAQAQREAGFYIIGMWGNGGHTIAMQSSPTSDTYRLFDANTGHFRISGLARFNEFLAQFVAKMGYIADLRNIWVSIPVIVREDVGSSSVKSLIKKFGG
jgi:hypothetical protein